MTADHIELAFALTVYDPADTIDLGGLTVRFQPVPRGLREHGQPVPAGGIGSRRSAPVHREVI